MKYLLLVLLTLSAVSCASHQESRTPSSEEMSDVSRGINTDSYGNIGGSHN